jgi:hypothetical protein
VKAEVAPSVGEYVAAAMSAFRAERRQKMVHAGGRGMRVHTAGERVIYLPNGHAVKVSVDDSGIATQVEEDEALHAIVRPHPIVRKLIAVPPGASTSVRVRPTPIRTSVIPRR